MGMLRVFAIAVAIVVETSDSLLPSPQQQYVPRTRETYLLPQQKLIPITAAQKKRGEVHQRLKNTIYKSDPNPK